MQDALILTRAWQLSLLLSITILVQIIFRYPHAPWTAFNVMMMYAVADGRMDTERVFARMTGVFLGLVLGYVCWYFGQTDYRSFIVLPFLLLYLAYFFMSTDYCFSTGFIVTLSFIGVGFFEKTLKFAPLDFLSDFVVCIVIAASLVICFEAFYCRYDRYAEKLSLQQYHQLHQHFLKLFDLLQHSPLKYREWHGVSSTCSTLLLKLKDTMIEPHATPIYRDLQILYCMKKGYEPMQPVLEHDLIHQLDQFKRYIMTLRLSEQGGASCVI